QSSAPCSMARAARWASPTRLPAVPRGPRSSRITAMCRSPGLTITTHGCASHVLTTSNARARDSGRSKTRALVLKRRKASTTGQLNATVSDPESCASTHSRAASCFGDPVSIAYSSRLASRASLSQLKLSNDLVVLKRVGELERLVQGHPGPQAHALGEL